MKKKEELNALKKEAEAANKKFRELTEEDLLQVIGGLEDGYVFKDGTVYHPSKLNPRTVEVD